MILIVFNSIVSTYGIGWAPIKLGIPPLPNVKRPRNIMATDFRRGIRIMVSFHKLFSPINKNCTSKKRKTIYDRNMSCHDCAYDNRKNIQCAYMPPYKFQGLFQYIPDWLYKVHRFFFHIYHQDNIIFAKSTLQIIGIYVRTLRFTRCTTALRSKSYEL